MSKKISVISLINKFNVIHNNKYDYSMVSYTRMSDKVKIICKIHGIFEQSPSNHLYKGCRKCGYEKIGNIFRKKGDEFISESKSLFKDVFDYDRTKYIDWKTRVILTCKIHGDFKVIPNLHIKGKGCSKCKVEEKKIYRKNITVDKLKIKQQNFITKSSITHDNFYNYNKVIYKGSTHPVSIICPTHGEFTQKPMHHLRGSGCQICGLGKRGYFSFSLYVDKCNRKFKNMFKYSNYTGISNTVDVTCPKHGTIKHQSSTHLRSQYGCKKCSYEHVSKKTSGRLKGSVKYTNDEFIKLISDRHNNRYGYSLVKYTGLKNKIMVICNKHGEFKIESSSHLSGCGCNKCSIENRTKKISNFINESNLIHNNKYDYSLTNYCSSSDKISIICKTHGEFHQMPDTHLRGSGCPKCFKFSRGEEIIENYLINNNIKYQTQKTFDGCKYINKLRFDFFIPINNTCIEFDGRQHSYPTSIYGGQIALDKQIKRDNVKTKYCQQNKLNLIRISYRDIKKINKILYDKLTT